MRAIRVSKVNVLVARLSTFRMGALTSTIISLVASATRILPSSANLRQSDAGIDVPILSASLMNMKKKKLRQPISRRALKSERTMATSWFGIDICRNRTNRAVAILQCEVVSRCCVSPRSIVGVEVEKLTRRRRDSFQGPTPRFPPFCTRINSPCSPQLSLPAPAARRELSERCDRRRGKRQTLGNS